MSKQAGLIKRHIVGSQKKRDKFVEWLERYYGCKILDPTNKYEIIRWKGSETGIIYNTGSVNSPYAAYAVECFLNGASWNGGSKNLNRRSISDRNREIIESETNGLCFICGKKMNDDVTVEHIVELSRGGSNDITNLTFAHQSCNYGLMNMDIKEKINKIIEIRSRNRTWLCKLFGR